MGTLQEQPPYRQKTNTSRAIQEFKQLAEEHEVQFYEVLEVAKLELRRAELDTRDEQLAGFGKLLERFVFNDH